jgi:hypothetical protein
MNLTIPAVGVTTGPEYADIINQDLSLIDAHDHTPGNGVQLTPASLNISSDLLFNAHSATNLLTANFNSQTTTLSAATTDSVYVANGDLYYNNSLGFPVQITVGSALAGTPGSISGLSSPASAVYNTGTFTFQSNVNTPANLDAGSVVLRNNIASSYGLTLSAPTLSTDESMVLPPIPSSPSFMSIDQFGNMNTAIPLLATLTTANLSPTAGILGTQLANNTLTSTQIANQGILTASIANGAISSTQIATYGVGTVNIAPQSVTIDKLSTSAANTYSGTSAGFNSTPLIPAYVRVLGFPTNPSVRTVQYIFQASISLSGTGVDCTPAILQYVNGSSRMRQDVSLQDANGYVPLYMSCFITDNISTGSASFEVFIGNTNGRTVVFSNVVLSIIQY